MLSAVTTTSKEKVQNANKKRQGQIFGNLSSAVSSLAATQPLFLRSGPPCRAGSGPEIRGKVDPNWQGTPGQFPRFMGSRLLPPTFDSNEIPRKQKQGLGGRRIIRVWTIAKSVLLIDDSATRCKKNGTCRGRFVISNISSVGPRCHWKWIRSSSIQQTIRVAS